MPLLAHHLADGVAETRHCGNMQIDIESSEIVSRFRIPEYYPTTEDINRLKEILNLA